MNFDFTDWTAVYLARLPNLIIALLVLLIGWIIAKAIGNAVEKGLKKTRWDERVRRGSHASDAAVDPDKSGKKRLNTNELIGKVVYYILLVFVLMIFFHLLNLGGIATPFMGMFGVMLGFIPAILKAALILLVAYVIATFLRMLVHKIGQRSQVINTMKRLHVLDNEDDVKKYTQTAGNIVFYLVMLLFIPAVLSALNIVGMAEPFRGMLDNMLAFIPKALAAAIILIIGWFVAKIIRDLVAGLLRTVGIEKLANKIGLQKVFGDKLVSNVIGTIVFVLIMIPIVISALDQLQIAAISDPAIAMLNDVMTMIPNIIIAVLLILVAVWIGKWVRQIITSLLQRVGFDSLAQNMEIGNWKIDTVRMQMSELVGYIAQVLVIFLIAIEALQLIKLGFLVTMLTAITAYLPMVFAAIIILAIGIIVANLVANVLSNILTGPSFRILVAVAKYSIIAISIFMALDQLHIAATIVNSAFILILGALALAFGLSFGLGGREFASNYLKKLDRTIEQTNVNTAKTSTHQTDQHRPSSTEKRRGMDQEEIKKYREDGGPEDFLPPKR